MPVPAAIVIAALLFAGPSAPVPQPVATPASATFPYPVSVQLATIVDHASTLAGQYVVLPPSRISRVLSPTLVELRDARECGPYHFGQSRKYDRLLALLPAGARVNRGDTVVVTGTVRTVRGISLGGQLGPAPDGLVKKRGNEAMLLAASVSTTDGVSLK